MIKCPDHVGMSCPKSKMYLRAADGWEFCTLATDFDELIAIHWLRMIDRFLDMPFENGLTLHIPDFHLELSYKCHWGRIDEASTIPIDWAYQSFLHYPPTAKYAGLLNDALILKCGYKAFDEMADRSEAEYTAYLENVRKASIDA